MRLIRKRVKGKVRYFAQLILEGKPLCKKKSPATIVGVDLGPSTVAVVSENGASLDKITPLKDKDSKNLQRKIARSREAHHKTTQRVRKLYTKLAEIKRCQAALPGAQKKTRYLHTEFLIKKFIYG